MGYEIIFAPEAIEDLRNLRADIRSEVKDAIATCLRFKPTKTSRSRIKRLEGMIRPEYRLRVGEYRIYYDVNDQDVVIISIVPKSAANAWLERVGERYEGSNSNGSDG